MFKRLLIAGGLAFLMTGCATTSKEGCPQNLSELDVLKTESSVTQCLGDSVHETSKPDGRHTRMYKFSGGISTVFLFDKDGNVIRHRSYQG